MFSGCHSAYARASYFINAYTELQQASDSVFQELNNGGAFTVTWLSPSKLLITKTAGSAGSTLGNDPLGFGGPLVIKAFYCNQVTMAGGFS